MPDKPKATWTRYRRADPALRKAIGHTAFRYKVRRWFWLLLFAALIGWVVLEKGELIVQAKSLVDDWVRWAASESKGYGPGN